MSLRVNRAILSAAAVAALLAGTACHAPDSEARAPSIGTDRPADARAIRSSDLRDLTLGTTSVAQIEQRFGEPDERAIDGALIYRWATVRRPDQSLGFRTIDATLGDGEQVVREESVKFQFAGGVLSKICRERS
jgi:hypothetical protein